MAYLWLVTGIWAFSFSLIGVYLAGTVDPWFSGFSRVFIAFLIFSPFLWRSSVSIKEGGRLALIGAIQIGAMYGFYYHSFLYLSVAEVLLFTVMTPIYITLLNDLLSGKFRPQYLLIALLAVGGAVAMRYQQLSTDYWFGLALVQGANVSFAAGQVLYKRLNLSADIPHHHRFAWFFIGALIVTSVTFISFGNWQKLPSSSTQWSILIYLGIVASGLGYFLWNKGVTQVSVAAVAVMNNVLIPAGLVVNVVIWQRDTDLWNLAVGSLLMGIALLWSYRLDTRNEKP